MTIQAYLHTLNLRYKTGISREHTYRGDLQTLLMTLLPDILVTNEPSRVACGAPDYVLTRKDLPVGYIEAKDIGVDLLNKTLKEQFDRYRAGLSNLIFTDYLDAGDAAHIHSPAGGQGMNTGLQDAYNISWKLAMVLQDLAGDKLLETYHTERYRFAKWLLKFTDNVFAVMTSTNVIASWFRIHFAPLIIRQVLNRKPVRRRLFRIISQIWYSYKTSPLSIQYSKQQLKFRAGDRFPFVQILIDGS